MDKNSIYERLLGIQKLDEFSLSRLVAQSAKYDCGIMTAFRPEYTKHENLQRNASLRAKLTVKRLWMSRVLGTYTDENGITSKEVGFFVVNANEGADLLAILAALGEEFDQDSILFIPQGASTGDAVAFLLGVSKREGSFPGYGVKKEKPVVHFGKEDPQFNTYVNGRPFVFEDICIKLWTPGNCLGWMSYAPEAKKHWRDIEIKDSF